MRTTDYAGTPTAYTCDAVGRLLTQVKQYDGNTVASETSYTYDAFGNEKNPDVLDVNPFRYCGEYLDAETGSYYLRARFYHTTHGRFGQEDNYRKLDSLYMRFEKVSTHTIQQRTNLHVYCLQNPILFVDVMGLYAREAAVAYAYQWYAGTILSGRNPEYDSYRTDCANFVSQSLFAGGIATNDDWHSYKKFNLLKHLFDPRPAFSHNYWYDWDVASTWRLASDQFYYFSNPENGFINGAVITITTIDELAEYAQSGNIQPGDLIYFVSTDDTEPHHAVLITKVEDGEIYYSAHTDSHKDKPLSQVLGKGNEYVYIVRIKDDA